MSQQRKSMAATVLASLVMVVFAACDRAPSRPAMKFPSAHKASNTSHFEALMAEEEFATGAKTPHCIALVAEIKTNRLAFTQSTDWKSILDTDEWVRFHGLYTGYRSGGCPSLTREHSSITQPCLEGREALLNAWNEVESLTSWKIAKQGAHLEGLVARWNDAKATGCLVVDEKA